MKDVVISKHIFLDNENRTKEKQEINNDDDNRN